MDVVERRRCEMKKRNEEKGRRGETRRWNEEKEMGEGRKGRDKGDMKIKMEEKRKTRRRNEEKELGERRRWNEEKEREVSRRRGEEVVE